jgi:hypothetical protein
MKKRRGDDKRKKRGELYTVKSQIKFETLRLWALLSAFSLVLIKLRVQIKKKFKRSTSLFPFYVFKFSILVTFFFIKMKERFGFQKEIYQDLTDNSKILFICLRKKPFEDFLDRITNDSSFINITIILILLRTQSILLQIAISTAWHKCYDSLKLLPANQHYLMN